MHSIVVGAIFLSLGCVACVLTIAFIFAPIIGGDPIAAAIGVFISAFISGVSISWGLYLLLTEPFRDEEAIRLAEQVLGANVNN